MNEPVADPSVRVTRSVLRAWPLPPPDGEGKIGRGDVWVVGGARQTPGAVMLAGQAALRVGAGRLTLAVAESVATAVAAAVPESGVVGLAEGSNGQVLGKTVDRLAGRVEECDALLVGPGLGDAAETADLLRRLSRVVGQDTAVVLDAYALGVLKDVAEVCKQWAGRLVLTPNSKELQRLLDLPPDCPIDRRELPDAVLRAAQRHEAVVTCQNIISAPAGQLWHCAPNCIGLGTSGSGDVLGGAVLGLLGRGATPDQAACWATYLHLSAGHRLSRSIGTVGFLAHELLAELPQVLRAVE